uniref:PlsC domain-containing protein n=1 Tax=Strongyloides stercoralis TaxID=6248 RepID=A0A0K0ELG0_STRER
MVIKRIKTTLFITLLFFSTFYGSIFVLFPFIFCIKLAPKVWRFIADRAVAFWLTFPAALCELLFGINFFISGDEILPSEAAIIIMNHRTRLDWMFLWNALYKINPWLLVTEKISLKEPLKNLFGIGWAMQCAGYLFLHRDFKSDRKNMELAIKYYSESGSNYQILFFPEGTDKGTSATDKSNEFARKNGLPQYDNVLHPRTTGFEYMISIMKKYNYISSVYDITVGYDEVTQSEIDLIISGKIPKFIHFDVKRYNINDFFINEKKNLLSINDDCKFISTPGEYLKKLWAEKEDKLGKFYRQKDTTKRCFLANSLDDIIHNKKYNIPSPYISNTLTHYIILIFSIFSWTFFIVFWSVLIYQYFFVRLYFLLAISFFLIATKIFNGLDNITFTCNTSN